METNDPKLKLAMARLLPEKLCWNEQDQVAVWLYPCEERIEKANYRVLETEWLYVVQLVEQALEVNNLADYQHSLANECGGFVCGMSATFNQRATAMCKVKGIKP